MFNNESQCRYCLFLSSISSEHKDFYPRTKGIFGMNRRRNHHFWFLSIIEITYLMLAWAKYDNNIVFAKKRFFWKKARQRKVFNNKTLKIYRFLKSCFVCLLFILSKLLSITIFWHLFWFVSNQNFIQDQKF